MSLPHKALSLGPSVLWSVLLLDVPFYCMQGSAIVGGYPAAEQQQQQLAQAQQQQQLVQAQQQQQQGYPAMLTSTTSNTIQDPRQQKLLLEHQRNKQVRTKVS